jgi:hypothetical protein
MIEEIEDQAAASGVAAWECGLDILLEYINPFEAYVNGELPTQLHSSAQGRPFALSYTSISKLIDNPLRFFEYVVNSKFLGRKEPSKAMLIGLIADDYILSRLFAGEEKAYICMESTHNKRTKAGKEAFAAEEAKLMEQNPNAKIVDKATYEKAQNVVKSLVGEYQYFGKRMYVREKAYDLLITCAVASKVKFNYVCPKYGFPIVGEVDTYGRDANGDWYAADLKSMAAVDNKTFYWNVRDRQLYLQAYIYKLALKQALGIDIEAYYVIAGCADGHSNIYKLSERDFAKGQQDYEQGLATFTHCLMLGASAFIKSYDIQEFDHTF